MPPVYGSGCAARARPPGRRRAAAGQASVGSTSTRSRPGGRATRGQPVAQRGVVVGPHQEPVLGQGRTPRGRPTPAEPVGVAPARPGPAAGPAPRTAGRPSWRADRPLGGGQQTRDRRGRRRPGPRGPGIRVWTRTRPPPPRAPTSRAARASRASASSPAREPGGQQVLVEVEEDHQAGVVDPVQGRLGPDHQPGSRPPSPATGVSAVSSTAGVASRAASSSVGPGHPDPERLELGRVADGAHRRPVLAAPPAGQHALGARPGPRRRRSGCSGPVRRSCRQASTRTRPVRLRTHTTRPPAPVELGVGGGRQPLGEQPGPGIVARPVDHLDHRPAPPLERPGRW